MPWLLLSIGWLAFHEGFAAEEGEHVWGTEAEWKFMGVFVLAWLCWGAALAISALALRRSTHQSLLWVCTVVNGLAFALPVAAVIFVAVGTSYAP
jgi:hypothetical protein